VRQIYPVQGADLQVVPKATVGPVPPAVAELARLYRNGAARDPAESQARRPWVRANMVASMDGAVSLAGRSGGLSGPADRMMFSILRSLADVILVGAGTARAERYRPAQVAGLWTQLRPSGAPPPPIAVVTASLNLDPESALLTAAADNARTIVITVADAPADRKAAIGRLSKLIEAGQRQVDVNVAISELGRLGYQQILCEGGPTLLGQLVGAGLIDDFCLTTTPVIAAGPASRIVTSRGGATASPAAELSLAQVLTDDSFLFSRYLRQQ
jgi:riboflavin biosynthesis pyrimidine reductase